LRVVIGALKKFTIYSCVTFKVSLFSILKRSLETYYREYTIEKHLV
jgi:hypothetical protein